MTVISGQVGISLVTGSATGKSDGGAGGLPPNGRLFFASVQGVAANQVPTWGFLNFYANQTVYPLTGHGWFGGVGGVAASEAITFFSSDGIPCDPAGNNVVVAFIRNDAGSTQYYILIWRCYVD